MESDNYCPCLDLPQEHVDNKCVRTVSGTCVCLLWSKRLDKALRDGMGLWGCPLQSQELDSILVDPFHKSRLFLDSSPSLLSLWSEGSLLILANRCWLLCLCCSSHPLLPSNLMVQGCFPWWSGSAWSPGLSRPPHCRCFHLGLLLWWKMIIQVLNYFLCSQEQLLPKRSILQLCGDTPVKKHRHTKNPRKPLLKIEICPICLFTDVSGSSHTWGVTSLPTAVLAQNPTALNLRFLLLLLLWEPYPL